MAIFTMALLLLLGTSVQASIVGEWRLDEGAGTTAADTSGNANNGTLEPPGSEPTWIAGICDDALRFDGRDDRVRVPDDPTLEPAVITAEAWVRRSGSPGAYSYILSKYATIWDGSRSSYAFYSGGSGGLYFYIGSASPAYVLSPNAGAGVWDGGWHHITGTYDGAAVRLYVDGAEVGAGTPTGAVIGYPGGDLFIGSYRATAGYRFSGDIDEVRIHDVALTADEVADLGDCPETCPDPIFEKVITGDNTDLAVEVGQDVTTSYCFTINYSDPDGPDVLIVDTVPAEWIVTSATESSGAVVLSKPGRGPKSKSATRIEWRPDPEAGCGSLEVCVASRQSPGKNNVKFAPTSCGLLCLNDGAAAYELDPATGEPLVDPATGERLPPIMESDPLCMVAVEDLNGGGIVGNGSGDEDGDGLSDLDEVLVHFTDPCNPDTDGDGVPDGDDPDPLDPCIPISC
jgi:hypothetical protein